MQMAVEDIKSESFYLSQEDLEAKKAVMQDKRKEITFSRKEDQAHQARNELLQMGNHLTEVTDKVIQHSLKFFKTFNKQFTYVRLETFIFQEADYIEVAIKEVQEIGKIFLSYEIRINALKNSHLYQKPESVVLAETVERVRRLNCITETEK